MAKKTDKATADKSPTALRSRVQRAKQQATLAKQAARAAKLKARAARRAFKELRNLAKQAKLDLGRLTAQLKKALKKRPAAKRKARSSK